MSREPVSTGEEARDPVEELAEGFLERLRRGERPSVEEYVEKHPDLAGQIRDLFPALLAMEEAGPDETLTEGSAAARRPEKALERLGEYRVLREIGRGGMGIVYEAEQETLGRRVALKVLLHGGFSDEVDLERFRREARAAARLHHTNIVPVFGIGEDGGTHYYAMQYIHGQSLASVLSEVRRVRFEGVPVAGAELPGGPGSTTGLLTGSSSRSAGKEPHAEYHRNVARLGLQAAEAIAYAHGEGVLHRDIKPSNLLLDTRGFLWVTDFGLAKAGDSGDLTARGSIVGTLRYMAPERLGGAEDTRSDVYSLGITLYELLTLRPAFDATDRARLVQDLAAREPPAPRGIDPAIPRDLETIILKSIAKAPRDRYAAAADLGDDLRRFLAYEPVKARRATTAERLWRWCQRNPTVAALCGAVVVLLAALAAGGMLSARSLRKERDAAFGLLMSSKLEEGRAWQRSGSLGQRLRSLEAFREAAAGSPALTLRSEVIGSLALTDMEVEEEWDMAQGGLIDDAHLERSAVRGPGSSVLVFGESRGEPIAVLPGGAHPARDMLFSPSSRFLAVCQGGPAEILAIWDIERKEALLELPSAPSPMPVAFHPRGDSIAHVEPGGGIAIRSFPAGSVLRRLPPGPLPRAVFFDTEGRRLAAVALEPSAHVVRIHDLERAAPIVRLHHPDAVGHVAWQPGGGLLATACQDFKVYLWDPITGKRIRTLEGHGAEVVRVAFSHGGGILASTGWDNQTFLWDLLSGEKLVAAPGVYRAFSRDDGRLGFTEGTRKVGIWRLTGGSEHRLLAVPSDSRRDKRPMDIAISPDGRWLAAECGHRGAHVWSLVAPDRALHLEIGWTEAVRFHPAGDSLLTGGAAGLLRWPIRAGEDGQSWTFGPAEPLGLPGGRFSLDAAGRTIAILRGNSVLVCDLESPGEEPARVEHGNAHRVELSPSGRWLVTTTWHGSEVRVWDARPARLAATFPSLSAHARWSPDERWLAVGTESGFSLHEAGTWKIRYRLGRDGGGDMPGTIAFSSDSRLVALVRSPTRVNLHWTETGEEAVSLQPLAPGYGGWMAISPDGNRLAMASPALQAVKLWDLSAIRRELAALGLDWDRRAPEATAPPPPPAPGALRAEYGAAAPGADSGSLHTRARDLSLLETATSWLESAPDPEQLAARAEVHRRLGSLEEALADLDSLVDLQRERLAAGSLSGRDGLAGALRARAELRAETGRVEEAIDDLVSVVKIDADDARSGVEVAWLWAVAASGEGDAERVLSAIEDTAARHPSDPRALAALGAAYYRLGRLAEAGTVLHEAHHIEGDEAPAPLLFLLALADHRTGLAGEARGHLQRAIAAVEKGFPSGRAAAACSRILRTEAERVLGVAPD